MVLIESENLRIISRLSIKRIIRRYENITIKCIE